MRISTQERIAGLDPELQDIFRKQVESTESTIRGIGVSPTESIMRCEGPKKGWLVGPKCTATVVEVEKRTRR